MDKNMARLLYELPEHEIKNAYERYILVISALKEKDDAKGIGLLESLIDSCNHYIRSVVEHCFVVDSKKKEFFASEDLYLDELSRVGNSRRMSHEALISSLSAFQRYLLKQDYIPDAIPEGGIYTGSSSERTIVADWAKCLVTGIYLNRER